MSPVRSRADLLPRGTAWLVGAPLAFALAATCLVRLSGMPPAASPAAIRAEAGIAEVASRSLHFLDRPDGAVVIDDAATGRTVAVIAAGEKTGFIRGVMRGLARDRHARGLGATAPFTLTSWADGQLSLTDDATGRAIELTAFGSTNRAAFAALLPGGAR